ncbi:MAG: hypothetical protein NC254_06235 [bacterium]|nr:hypothetical protein [bacterium]
MYRLLLWLIMIFFFGVQENSFLSVPPDVENLLPDAEQNNDGAYIEPVFGESGAYMQSVGEARFPVFMVSFQDVTYRRNRVTQQQLTEWLFAEEDSVKAYYDTASHGRLHVDGDVYFYEAEGEIASYENENGFEDLVMEVLSYYDGEIDFSEYDCNGDAVMDALVISVPSGGDVDFWWGCQATWYQNPEFRVDGIAVNTYIINDEQPYIGERTIYQGTVEHELGHCMGLPDYYKYNSDDSEGFHGIAGMERMDDSSGDFCQFSKLMLGWLRTDQVQVMEPDMQSASFQLLPAHEGSCLVIFPEGGRTEFNSEYFLVEYNTPEGNNEGLFAPEEAGVRIFHVNARTEIDSYDGVPYYRYENFSTYYNPSDEGIRILKLVHDGEGFYQTGDSVRYGEASDFGWYTTAGSLQDPRLTIRIGEVTQQGITVEVTREASGTPSG